MNRPIQIYLTESQHHNLKRLASNRRVSLSDYVREQLGLPHVQQGVSVKKKGK